MKSMYKNLLLATALCLSVGTAKAITIGPKATLDSTAPFTVANLGGVADEDDVFNFLKSLENAFAETIHKVAKKDFEGVAPEVFNIGPGGMVLTQSGDKAGTWKYEGTDTIWAFVVKGATTSKIYYLFDAIANEVKPIPTSDGIVFHEYDWSTSGLVNRGGQQPEASHVSLWGSKNGGTTNVPEPATAAIALGLIGGLAFLRRRK